MSDVTRALERTRCSWVRQDSAFAFRDVFAAVLGFHFRISVTKFPIFSRLTWIRTSKTYYSLFP